MEVEEDQEKGSWGISEGGLVGADEYQEGSEE